MDQEDPARNIPGNFIDCAPQGRDVQQRRTKPEDEEIGLAFSKETDDGIDFVSFNELRREFESFALRGRFVLNLVKPAILLYLLFALKLTRLIPSKVLLPAFSGGVLLRAMMPVFLGRIWRCS